MKIINKEDNKVEFQAEIEETLANAIRRYLNQIPVLAVDEVDISNNDSALYDETIAHRIGLIPLKMDKSMNEKTEIQLTLNIKNEGIVHSGNLTGKTKVVYDSIPITSLKKGQKISLIATAKLGKGVNHPKFSPGLMFYRNIAEIKLDKECPAEIAEVCPARILNSENGKVTVTDNSKCDMCEACVEFCNRKRKGSVTLTPTKELMITIESWGQLSLTEMIKKSIEVLKKDLNEVGNKFK